MHKLDFFATGRKVQTIYASFCQPVCQKYGINQTCLDVLLFLANHPSYNTARDVCTVRGIKSGNVSVAVECLIRLGYLSRAEEQQDRRVRRLMPTERAEPLIRETRALQKHFFASVTEGISQEELEAYKAVTEKFVTNIRRLEQGDKHD